MTTTLFERAFYLIKRGALLTTIAACTAAAAATPSALPMSEPDEYAALPISVAAGENYFLHTGGGDPYATGIAYPVFLALMEAYPKELGADWKEFGEKFGMAMDPAKAADPRALPVGFHLTTDPNTSVPWLVANCQMCHAERLRLPSGDVLVSGLGNKRVRPHAYMAALVHIGSDPGLDEKRITELASKRASSWNVPWKYESAIVKASVEGLRKYAADRGTTTKRMEGALPGRMATIESFAMMLAAESGTSIPPTQTIGGTKVPDVSSFPYRDTFSYDASGYGSPQALVLDADFLMGARQEWYRTHPHIATSMYMYLKGFKRQLDYPKPIDTALAAEGKTAFESKCSRCHGYYIPHGDEMRVSYKERIVPLEIIGTDSARADAVTDAYVDAANAYPLTQGHARVRRTGGYVPPVLLDVWARGVLGHAGQWPSLSALAMSPEGRPKMFIVDTNGMYDLERVGVRYEVVSAPRALKPGEYLYDGTKPGYLVGGHTYLADLPPTNRRAVIEYLKTL